MRIKFSSLVAFYTGAHAVALMVTPKSKVNIGLHSEYVIKGTNNRIQLFIPDYQDEVKTFETSANFTPTAHWERGDRAALQGRDFCARITDCAGYAASSAVAWAQVAKEATVTNCNAAAGAVNDYLTDDNYGAVRSLMTGSVVIGLVITLVASVPQYFINAKLEATYGNSESKNDACGEKDPATFASNAASAVYEFCLSIQHEAQSAATANFDTLDMTGSGSKTGGYQGRAKMFISEQAATWGPICHDDYGVDWKHKLRRNPNNVFGS